MCLDYDYCLRTLIHALVFSRLDYCNWVLYGLPASTLQPLTTVLRCAAKLIKNLSPRDHVTPILRELHWLLIPARINFKICLVIYRVLTNSSPLICFLACYILFISPIQTISTIFVSN